MADLTVSDLHLIPADTLREDKKDRWIYTIGNINGNADLLLLMLDEIENKRLLAKGDKIVLLGNFISETGNTKRIINILRDYQEARPDQLVVIRGANEQKMLQARISFFKSELGQNALESYRLPKSNFITSWRKERLDIKKYSEHTNWLASLPCYYSSDKFFFVHSGVNPYKELTKQSIGGFMFIDKIFQESPRTYDKVIVFSHKDKKLLCKTKRIGIGQSAKPTDLVCYILDDKSLESKPTAMGKYITDALSVSEVA